MNVIAFRPRRAGATPADSLRTAVTGTFRSPRGLTGHMTGHLRIQRLVLAPRGTFVTGIFTGELREPDGALIGRESRRATVPADLVRDDRGLHPVVRPLQLDLMGIGVHVPSFAIEPAQAFPPADRGSGRGPRGHPGRAARQVGGTT